MRKVPALLLTAILAQIAIASCTVNNATPENSCILSEIQFAENSRLVFTTISGGQIYQLRQELLREDEDPLVAAAFQFQYFVDSLVVRNQLEEDLKYPYMTVKFEEDKPKRVEKYFGGSGVRLIHEKNLFLPFFTDTNFPDARFFSPNNVLLARNESGTFNYQYGYDEFGNMTSMIQPDGTPVYYRYIGCGN